MSSNSESRKAITYYQRTKNYASNGVLIETLHTFASPEYMNESTRATFWGRAELSQVILPPRGGQVLLVPPQSGSV